MPEDELVKIAKSIIEKDGAEERRRRAQYGVAGAAGAGVIGYGATYVPTYRMGAEAGAEFYEQKKKASKTGRIRPLRMTSRGVYAQGVKPTGKRLIGRSIENRRSPLRMLTQQKGFVSGFNRAGGLAAQSNARNLLTRTAKLLLRRK